MKQLTTHQPMAQSDYQRVVVSRWDKTYIYCTPAEGGELMRVGYGGERDEEWAYLRDMLREGCQLNLVRPQLGEDGVWPDLIVYEPDYLVDISAIAACFESYSHSPLMHLLHRLQPSQSSAAIVLGNLASQFLDEELCLTDEENTYAQSIKQFFREHTLQLMTTTLPPDFHKQAQEQKRNIRSAIRETLPTMAGEFQPENVMVEPSFFSEMLGIQGRMDFLQLDMRVLIEQKSGKGGFPQPNADTPAYQLKHYVQLLLYMLLIQYNYHDRYELNGGELHAFLLYSKYAKGLLRAPYKRELVLEAMRLRNGIVANEYAFSQRCLQPLSQLTAEQCNTLRTHGQLWERYQRPQLDELLAPIHAASPLERAYYLRMLAFVQTEHLLAKVGRQSQEHASFADKWYSSLTDKLAMGNIYHQLEMLYPTEQTRGKVDRVVLRRHDNLADDVSNFRRGDIVILYAYTEGSEPDARRTMVFRCTLADIGTDEITLLIRATQTDARVFWQQTGSLWAIEHDFFESSFSSLYRGLHAMLSAPKSRRDLLLLQRPPRHDSSLSLRGDYGGLNELATRVKQALDLFIIIGPPGTGKTSFGMLNTLKEELLDPESAILIMAYTNRAVDEICDKLIQQDIDFLRIGGALSCDDAYRPYLLGTVASNYSHLDALREAVTAARVIVGTTTAFNAFPAFLSMRSFSLAIIDEASQILEPHLTGLLSAQAPDGTSSIRKVVMIGDHKQLPAVVQQSREQSIVTDPALNAIHLTDCRLSLFERLLCAYRDDLHVVYQLTRQGRMHPAIADFPSREFYRGMLQAIPLPHQQRELEPFTASDNSSASFSASDILQSRRVAFIDVERCGQSDLPAKVNPAEAEVIAEMVRAAYILNPAQFRPQHTVGVIVPYRNQIAAVRSAIQRTGIDILSRITIDTVERFQGSQRDIIIYGCTVSQPDQLAFLTESTFTYEEQSIDRKLNVAITRAREHLIVCGWASLLSSSDVYRRFIHYCRSRSALFGAINKFSKFKLAPLDDNSDAT